MGSFFLQGAAFGGDRRMWSPQSPLILDFRGTAGSSVVVPPGCTFTRAACVDSVQTGTSSLITIASAADVLRYGRALDSWDTALVLEEARTNYITYSSDYTTGGGRWTLAGTVTKTAGQTGPDGTASATRVQAATAGDYQYFRATGLGASAQIVASSWVRPRTPPADVAISATGGGGVAALAATAWGRLSSAGPATGTGVCDLYTVFGGDIPAVITAGARDWHLFGSQIELGRCATELIPTSGATATRHPTYLGLLSSVWTPYVAPTGRMLLEVVYRPKCSSGSDGASGFFFIGDLNASVYVNGTTRVLSILSATTNTVTLPAWVRGDLIELWIETGGGIATVVKVRVNGGAVSTLAVTGSPIASMYFAPENLSLFSYTSPGFHLNAWLHFFNLYPYGQCPAWAA